MRRKGFPATPIPTVAQRARELKNLRLPGAVSSQNGRTLYFKVGISPGSFGRLYQCLLKIKPDGQPPDAVVLEPDLSALAGGKQIPHTYAYDGKGTRLCLWWPKSRDWMPSMKLTDTFIPWIAEWLYYFELWLLTGEWSGGGEHPDSAPKRWARSPISARFVPSVHSDQTTPV